MSEDTFDFDPYVIDPTYDGPIYVGCKIVSINGEKLRDRPIRDTYSFLAMDVLDTGKGE
jgi:hypothetical protein